MYCALATLLMTGAAQAKIITVNAEDNADFGTGKTNLVTAINLLADGDTINFNIPGNGVHYLLTPVDGYPLITNQNVTLDGYSQPGAFPNSNPIHAANNAQIKIVLSSTNGNAMAIRLAAEAAVGRRFGRPGFNDNDNVILGFFRGTNNWGKGFTFQGVCGPADSYYNGVAGPLLGIGFMADDPDTQPWPDANAGHWHVSGCWFGLNPATGQPAFMPDGKLATPIHGVSMQRHRNQAQTAVNYAQPGTFGVAAGSPDPRAEFNVVLAPVAANLTGLNYRLCGNFFNVLPDGMHNYDIGYMPDASTVLGSGTADGMIIIARQGDNMVIGTDGDGVNDADEGNVFGGASVNPFSSPAGEAQNWSLIDAFYGPAPSTPTQGTNNIVAGNYFGLAVDGVTRFANSVTLWSGFSATGDLRFGSDFDGVSDDLEANLVFNNYPFSTQYPLVGPTGNNTPVSVFDGRGSPRNFTGINQGMRFAMRGNVTVGNDLLPYKYANGATTLLTAFTNYEAPYMVTTGSLIPTVSATSTAGDIIGSCAAPNGIYTYILVDVYTLDPEGWANGKLFEEQELTDYVTYTNGFPQGKAFLGTFVDNGPLDRDPTVGSFNFSAAALGLAAGTQVIVIANYSADPAGTHNGRTRSSNFSDPATLRPALKITSVTPAAGNNVMISWTGGAPPYTLQKRSPVTGTWSNVQSGIGGLNFPDTITGNEAYNRVLGN